MLNGGAVNVGGVQVAGVSGAGKTAELVIAGKDSRFTSGSSVSVGDYGNGVLSVIDDGSFSAGSNTLIGDLWFRLEPGCAHYRQPRQYGHRNGFN